MHIKVLRNFWYVLILECWQIVFKARCDGEELLNDGGSLGEMMKGGMAMARFRVSKK
jgi:hypothetical protein